MSTDEKGRAMLGMATAGLREACSDDDLWLVVFRVSRKFVGLSRVSAAAVADEALPLLIAKRDQPSNEDKT